MPVYSTFANDQKARRFEEIKSVNDVFKLIEEGVFDEKYYFLGKGANTLFRQDYDGTIVKNCILGKEAVKPLSPKGDLPLSGENKNSDEIIVRVGAGEDREEFVLWTIEQGYLGLENLVDIPGSVGAAPIQNIGAYGAEVADCIVSVEGIWIFPEAVTNPSVLSDISPGHGRKKSVSLSREYCEFGYRDSVFKRDLKGKFLIMHVTFKLQKNIENYKFNLTYQGILNVMLEQNISESDLTQAKLAEIISSIRASKLPDYKKLGTAGSFFQNPIITKTAYEKLKQEYPNLVSFAVENTDNLKLSAGQLIDICGLKNYRIGSVGTYEKHALVLVNYGGASGAEIWEFAKMIQKKVQKKFSVLLEVEVNII